MVILWLMIINMGRSYDISHYISNQVYLNKRIIANLSRQWCFLFSIILFCIILFQSVQNLSIFFYISSSKIYRFLLFDYYFLLKISQFFIVDRNFFIFHPFFKIYQFLFYFFSKFPQIRIFLCYSFSKFTNFSSLFKISRFLNFFIFFSPSKLFQTFLYISNFSQISFKLSPLENLSIFQIYSLSLSLSSLPKIAPTTRNKVGVQSRAKSPSKPKKHRCSTKQTYLGPSGFLHLGELPDNL